MARLKAFLNKASWLPFVLAGIGGLLYLWQTWQMSQTLGTASLDESMYIYKGYLFASGKYAPYQDYGPLTNHMPLAFMIPGYIQLWFGPGIAAGRAFAFATSAVMLLGIWLAFYRLGGGWWAAGIVWLFALNPSWQEVFSQGLTQGLVNTFIAWAFVFLIGQERKNWQLMLATGLAALAVMTRINTLPILGLLVLYVFWQHGWKKGLYASLAALLVGSVVLAIFWPGVLKFISGWVPEGLLGFMEPYRSSWSQQHVPEDFSYLPVGTWFNDRNSWQWNGVYALYESFHHNFIPYLAVLGALFFWPRKADWPDQYRFRLSILLITGWVVMAGMHMWVALSGTSCDFFCLSGYFSFFNLLALLLLPASFSAWRRKTPIWRQALGLAVLFGVVTGGLNTAGYRIRRVRGRWLDFLSIQIPRMKDGRIIQGETGPLLALLESKLGLSYKFLVDLFPPYLYWLLLGLLIFVLVPLIYRAYKKRAARPISLGHFSFTVFMGLALVLAPTKIFYNQTPNYRCEEGVIESHEQVGADIDAFLPDGAKVYWALTSNMLLLYLPDVEIFPPQLNTSFNFVDVSEPEESDEIYRFGYWDEDLKTDWLAQADYLLISGERIERWEDTPALDSYQLVETTAPYENCRPTKSIIYIYQHINKD